jgi:PTH1 family peptidyl-tRNA hydrolase
MKLIVGLGNPGLQYETTRHNAGFLAIDRLADVFQARGPTKESNGEIFQTTICGEKALLIKPQTFMNNSGKCIAPIFKFYKCEPSDLIVIHDEVDLPPLSLRIKTGGSSGGHNGLRSLDQHLGASNTAYHRIRVGVGKPSAADPRSTADWVLAPFDDRELSDLDPVLDDIVKVTQLLVEGNALKAMNDFNRKERADSDKKSNQAK